MAEVEEQSRSNSKGLLIVFHQDNFQDHKDDKVSWQSWQLMRALVYYEELLFFVWALCLGHIVFHHLL